MWYTTVMYGTVVQTDYTLSGDKISPAVSALNFFFRMVICNMSILRILISPILRNFADCTAQLSLGYRLGRYLISSRPSSLPRRRGDARTGRWRQSIRDHDRC